MRAEIEADLRKQQAQKQFAEAAETFSNLVYEQGDSLQPAAQRLKLEVQTVKGLKRQPQPGTGVLANERLLEAVFSRSSLESKRNIEAVETASGQLVSARVLQHSTARTLPLAEVRGVVRDRLVAQRAADLAREAGEKQLAAWQGGADAAGLSAPVTVSRDNPQGVAAPVLNAALSADARQLPVWVGVPQGQQGYTVVQVVQAQPRPAPDPQIAAQEVQQYGQWLSALEAEAYYETLKDRFKVRIQVPAPAGIR
jgi:peptidyl-prolyl cis-trans isomerase D